MGIARANLMGSLLVGVLLASTGVGRAADTTPLHQVIDAELSAVWQRENLAPAAASSDTEFARRVWLDLVGVIPSVDELSAFLDDTSADKRIKLIDRLLADERFANAQAVVWDNVLFGRDPPGADATRKRDGFVKWLRDELAGEAKYDRMVRQMLLAEGNSAEQGAPLFLVQFRNRPEEAADAVTRLFLGVQLQCARCHDHPSEPWTQKDFMGMAAFFSRLKVVENGKAGTLTKYVIAEGGAGDILFSGPAKDQKPGMKGEPVKPRFLDGATLDEPATPKDYKEPKTESGKVPPKPAFSRKEKLAAWVVSPENPYFARAVVNRVWAQFMGRGLVDPVDDFTPSKRASHPALLDALAAGFRENEFDLRWLVREIVRSNAYQLSSAGPSTDANPKWYERARVRPLSAEELIASLRVASRNDQAEKLGAKMEVGRDYFMRFFGEPLNGRGVFQGSIDEHLFLNNSSELRRFTDPVKGNLADELIASTEPAEKVVDRMFLGVLSRAPSDAERARFVAFLATVNPKEKDAKRKIVPQAIWVLMNTAEFRFNH